MSESPSAGAPFVGADPSLPAVDTSQHVRWPVLTNADREAVQGVLDRGILSGQFAPEVRGLERAFAQAVGSRFAVATNSGTAALHVALAAAGVGPGDEVLVPAFTFVATALAVLHHCAIPVFVDVEPRTLGMDPVLAERAITPRTKAILPVHLHGVPCELGPLVNLAERHGLVLIEDAAQAHGATYRGRPVGTYGKAGCFSLQSSKSLACGEGGVMVTDDEALFTRACQARMFGEGSSPDDEAHYDLRRPLDGNRAYDSRTMGWMYRTNELSAALARSQLHRLSEWNDRGRANAALLSSRLGALPGITVPEVPDDRVAAFHKYRVRMDARAVGVNAPPKVVRDAVVRALRAQGLEAVLWQTVPVPAQGLFQKQVGYGVQPGQVAGVPWSLGSPVRYDLDQYPVTTQVLDGSLCLFSQSCPIAPQSPELVAQYAEVFASVWGQLERVLAAAERTAR